MEPQADSKATPIEGTIFKGAQYDSKVDSIIHGGTKTLIIISDFDRTLTWRVYSSYGLFQQSPLITDKFRIRAIELLNKYYPMECDINATQDFKYKAMNQWWIEANENVVNSCVSRKLIREVVELAVRSSPRSGMLRGGAATLLETASREGIPLTIFSAGVTPIIAEMIRQESNVEDINGLEHSLSLVSNDVIWSGPEDTDVIAQFIDPVIHSMNKEEVPIEFNVKVKARVDELLAAEAACEREGRPFDAARGVPHVILIGDTLNDSKMADTLVKYWMENTIHKESRPVVLGVAMIGGDSKVGKEDVDYFLKDFDVVVTNDSPLDLVNSIVNQTIANN